MRGGKATRGEWEMAKKRKEKSERHPVGDNGSGHFVEFEYVPNVDNAREIYTVLDGRRIAFRGKPGTAQAMTWVSMVPGYEVVDVGSNYDKVAVYFSARTVQ